MFSLLAATTLVVLTWTAPQAGDVVGYRLYAGSSPGVYDERIDVGNVTRFNYSKQDIGPVRYFAVAAYNPLTESVKSSEVSAYFSPYQCASPVPGISDGADICDSYRVCAQNTQVLQGQVALERDAKEKAQAASTVRRQRCIDMKKKCGSKCDKLKC